MKRILVMIYPLLLNSITHLSDWLTDSLPGNRLPTILEKGEEKPSNDIIISATTSITSLLEWLADNSLPENHLPTILEEDEEESSKDVITSITTTTTHTPSLQQLVDSMSELVDNFESGGGVRSDHSGSDYSGDSDDMSDASFSDDDDDGLFHVPPSPSSYADLSNMYLDGPEPSSQKKYRSGWWENIGSKRSLFPISYTKFEESDRLPSLLEESSDDEALCESSHSREETSDTS